MAVVIKKKINSFPANSGVYLMKDKQGKVIYVGKAANLKKRVRSYFSKAFLPYKTQRMIEEVNNIEYVSTLTEHEAFLLESKLIKKLQPHFNVSLKDDKSFPFIKITKEEYPHVFIGRKKRVENVEHFGPYTNAKFLRLALKSIRRIFPFCSCRRFPKRVCLNYDLKLCAGPCVDKISKSKYRKMINDFKYFLRNGRESLISKITQKMQKCVKQQKFEIAKELRDQIKALTLLSAQSKIRMADILGLDKEPECIEAFDISNLHGKEATGSMVTFVSGRPNKNDYRRFKIRGVKGIDDYKMLAEVLRRRYGRVIREDLRKPDLILIDGGKGHLGIARGVLRELGLNISIIAIAKDQELIYTVNNKNPISLAQDNEVLQLIQHIRDEAHRFAIKYHKFLRKKKVFD